LAAGGSRASHGGFCRTHAAETRAEQAIVMERYGARVIQHLDRLGLLGPRTVLAHCVHLDEREIALRLREGRSRNQC